MWKCPHCEAELEELEFTASTRGWEAGSAFLSKENEEQPGDRILDYDYSDSATDETDDYEYKCPECEHNIHLETLIWITDNETEEEEKKIKHKHENCFDCKLNKGTCYHKVSYCKHCKYNQEPEPEETLHKIIRPKTIITVDRQPEATQEDGIICKKCKYVFVYETAKDDSKDEFYECPKCRTVNSKKEYQKTLEN